MKKNAYSQLKEEILGQAALNLLLMKKPVTLIAMVNQLMAMQENETDPIRLLAFSQAIKECNLSIASLEIQQQTSHHTAQIDAIKETSASQPPPVSKGKLH